MAKNIDNSMDIIDSRDVITRIEELQSLKDDDPETFKDSPDEQELSALENLAEEGSASSPDWSYGEALIRDSYFEIYAQELAEDIGAVPKDLSWPACHIDWDAATNALKMDYTEVDFDGVSYWIRA